MPHLILEYSSNLFEKGKLVDLLPKINDFLTEKLPAELSACKGRAVERDTYCVGNGDPKNAFVHIHLKIMSGRTPEKLNAVGVELMEMLKTYFQHSGKELNLQISIEIEELQATYFKS